MTDARGWTGHWFPATHAGYPGSAPQGIGDGEEMPSPGSAFRSSPTSLSSCARVDFSREKSGQGRDRFYCGAVFYVTLQQCLFPLGKAKW